MKTVVTNATGGTTKPVGVLYVLPDRAVLGAGAGTKLEDTGLNADFVADLLSACLTHERCGLHLYRSVGGRSNEASLIEQYEHFGEETAEHIRILEELITSAGGNPQYVSPMARATEKAGAALLELTYLIDGSLDPISAEMTMLEAVMLAEAKDRANWEMMTQLAEQMAESPVREQMRQASEKVLGQEIDHHSWARDTRAAMAIMLAGGTPAVSSRTTDKESAGQR
jgi:rubrerythrin